MRKSPDFQHGRLSKIYLNGVDLSRVLNSASVSGGYDTSETTTFGQGYQSFMTGLRNGGEVSFDGRVEAPGSTILRRAVRDAEGRDDSILSLSFGNDAVAGAVGAGLRGLLGTKEFSMTAADVAAFTLGFAGNRGTDDVLALNGGGVVLTTTGTGTAVDDDAASAANTQAVGYLHVLDLAGGTAPSVTAKIQHSPDNSAWTDLVTFSAATANRTAQRVVVNTVPQRYFRASWTITGTPTSVKLAISVARGRANEDIS